MASLFYNSKRTTPVVRFAGESGQWEELMFTKTERFQWFTVQLPSVPVVFTVSDESGCIDSSGPPFSLSVSGRYVLHRGSLLPIFPQSRRLLLVSDLDGTLIRQRDPEGVAASTRFVHHWLQRHYFNGSKLVYSTGRFLQEVKNLRETNVDLLLPDLLITDMGSDAYTVNRDTGMYEARSDYQEACPAHCWNTDIVSQALDSHFPWLIHPLIGENARLRTWRFVHTSDLSVHEPSLQSFVTSMSAWPSPIQGMLHISTSGELRYLDVTAANAGKRPGVDFSKQLFGMSDEDTLVAGDSAIDFGLFEGDEYGVMPSNSEKELTDWLAEKDRGPKKYQSTLQFADAVVEALNRLESH